ncbi:hypothetical protein [Methylobacterium sp. ID0610]|uniref:hypothetical protein n=1 Tax=Methylobacterium carpenticola TaxID=3344827 RepID=UPI0036C508E1
MRWIRPVRRRGGRGLRILVLAALAAAPVARAQGQATAGDGGQDVDAAASKDVTWAVYDAAPFMITAGPDREQGVFDQIRHFLDARLKGITYRTVSAPFPRIVSALKDGAPWCFIGGVRTLERESFAYFSLPVAMFYPLRIIVRADRRARFDALGPLSLRDLLVEHPELRTSTLRNRALTPALDALFHQHPARQVHSDFREAFLMLQSDRLDYLVDYANIGAYYAREFGSEEAFVGLPFAESPEPVFSRVMCARTPWGRALVERVDAILRVERSTPEYRRIVGAWSGPEDLTKIQAVYDGVFLTSE